jgi:acetyl esterase/lipase
MNNPLPQFSWLHALAAVAFSFSALTGLAPAQQATTAPLAGPRQPGLSEGARVLREIAYVENGHQRQKLDLYVPAKPAGPLLVWIHGGGWRGGDKNNPPGLAALEKGVTIASINYRLSQHALFPAQIEDCKAAVRWLRAHAADYGYDGKKVAVWGASAGGHLAALLAVTGQVKDFDVGANLDQSSAVQSCINWFGPADFEAYDPKLPTEMVQRENKTSVLALLFGGPISEKLELARRASPVTWVTKDAAPMLIMQGTKDPLVPLDQSQRLADRLKAAGADVTLDVIEGAGHGGPQFTAPEKVKLMADFLGKHFER